MADMMEDFSKKQEMLRRGLIDFMLNGTLTWNELANEVGLSRFTILNFARHKKDIGLKTMGKIERFLASKVNNEVD
jgi:transposase